MTKNMIANEHPDSMRPAIGPQWVKIPPARVPVDILKRLYRIQAEVDDLLAWAEAKKALGGRSRPKAQGEYW